MTVVTLQLAITVAMSIIDIIGNKLRGAWHVDLPLCYAYRTCHAPYSR